MVEYALILIPFLLLVMGIFDFGRGILYYNMLSNAAREGARWGIVASRTSDQICARAKEVTLLPNVDLTDPSAATCGATGDVTVTVPDRGTQGDPNDPVQVTLTYTFRVITPLIGNIVEQAPGCLCITLSATSTMYIEN